jgi:hypothetical protein
VSILFYWSNIIPELKETHLAPLANTFSRSTSQSTIVGEQPSKTSSSSTLVDSKDATVAGKLSLNNDISRCC